MKHIAICQQPFFDMILCGKKTIESRWSTRKIPPYNRVQKGDMILLKETGKDVTAQATAREVMYYDLTPEIADEIRLKYGKEIGIDFFSDWQEKRQKRYCTLIWLENIKKINPIKVRRGNRSGWISENSERTS